MPTDPIQAIRERLEQYQENPVARKFQWLGYVPTDIATLLALVEKLALSYNIAGIDHCADLEQLQRENTDMRETLEHIKGLQILTGTYKQPFEDIEWIQEQAAACLAQWPQKE